MNSYRYIDYSWQLREKRDRNPGYDCYETIGSDSMGRVMRWLYLLKDIEVQTTPDVVAIYLIATCQERLISNLYKARPNLTEKHHYNYVGIGVDCCCDLASPYDFCPIGLRDGELVIPKELITMASKYMKQRVSDFIRLISGCVRQNVDEAITKGIEVRSFIYNAVTGMNKEIYRETTIANIVSAAKALNATVMPTCTLAESYRQTLPGIYHKGKVGLPINDSTNREVRADKNYKNCLGILANGLDIMSQTLEKNVSSGIRSDDLKDGFCALAEALLFISGCTLGLSPIYMAFAPSITRMNKLKFSNYDNPRAGCSIGVGTGKFAKSLNIFRNISPAAAICLGDTLFDVCNRRYDSYYIDKILSDIPERINNDSVIVFLEKEIREQFDAMYQVKQLIEIQKSEYIASRKNEDNSERKE